MQGDYGDMSTVAEYEDAECQMYAIHWEQKLRDAAGQFVRACHDCGERQADPPSELCPGCEAYRAHIGVPAI